MSLEGHCALALDVLFPNLNKGVVLCTQLFFLCVYPHKNCCQHWSSKLLSLEHTTQGAVPLRLTLVSSHDPTLQGLARTTMCPILTKLH